MAGQGAVAPAGLPASSTNQQKAIGFFTGTQHTPFMLNLGYYNLHETFAKYEQNKDAVRNHSPALANMFDNTHALLLQAATDIQNNPALAAKYGGPSIYATVMLASEKHQYLQAKLAEQNVAIGMNPIIAKFSSIRLEDQPGG
jgi:hypothetical protein